ncbi:hypothetical protein CPC08DRAFT_751027 [Agrocybe pediades]|nr:hypothetical protein CPC08DRAFT_751027 [Agrocybe pediades]
MAELPSDVSVGSAPSTVAMPSQSILSQACSASLPTITSNSLSPFATNEKITETRDEYLKRLATVRRKEPLRALCEAVGLSPPKSANLERIREILCSHWFSTASENHVNATLNSNATALNLPRPIVASASQSEGGIGTDLPTIRLPRIPPSHLECLPEDDEEAQLVRHFGVEGAGAEDVLGFGEDEGLDEEECEEGVEDVNGDEESIANPMSSPQKFKEFQQKVRMEEAKLAEQNRRAGGVKTQNSVIKAWKQFCLQALDKGEIRDTIIDEHHLLLFIRYTAERPKKTSKGVEMPGTRVGASHIKKLYFGVLRIRKLQEAEDPSLELRRPAKSIYMWEALKGRMNDAIKRERTGIGITDDAVDITANTFLEGINDEQIEKVSMAFLTHRELRSTINGHLAWTAQNASGNRGDDFRALRLSELQPYTFTHPDGITRIPCLLGCQGEEKAGASRSMKTKVNPVYSVFIAHKNPIQDSLGAFSFLLHYLVDLVRIIEKLNIDFSRNKSWRQIRVLHGQKSPTTPFNEQSLYNLFVNAFRRASFISRLKVHLPRHILGYFQEKMGVDPSQTARMGWTRNHTYFDTYAPAFPKEAILGAHGYKVHEVYDPVWRHVDVPERFLKMMCPMAESIHETIVGKENLLGASNFWELVISLRPYLFQCGAAIFQKCPESPIFRLPALADQDVQNWMKTEYPLRLSLLNASRGSEIDLARLQDHEMKQILSGAVSLMSANHLEVQNLASMVKRRTAVLSPSKSYSHDTYYQRYEASTMASRSTSQVSSSSVAPSTPPRPTPNQLERRPSTISDIIDNTAAVYQTPDGGLRAFVNRSPKTPTTPRARTHVDLVLPPSEAFSERDGLQMIFPPLFGQHSITWDQVFNLVKRPEFLWSCWGPSKTLDKYTLEEQWAAYISGECVFDDEGNQTGVKPPLREVEERWQARWRKDKGARKSWERFLELPAYILKSSKDRGVSADNIISELQALRMEENGRMKGLSALSKIIKARREEEVARKQGRSASNDPSESDEATRSGSISGEQKKRKAPVEIRRHPGKKKKME